MKIAIYPGSFNPFHQGHLDVIKQIAPLFDKIIIAIGQNPEKPVEYDVQLMKSKTNYNSKVEIIEFTGLLKDAAFDYDADVVIRGLRNSQDFEYEKTQQYWNEDLGELTFQLCM